MKRFPTRAPRASRVKVAIATGVLEVTGATAIAADATVARAVMAAAIVAHGATVAIADPGVKDAVIAVPEAMGAASTKAAETIMMAAPSRPSHRRS